MSKPTQLHQECGTDRNHNRARFRRILAIQYDERGNYRERDPVPFPIGFAFVILSLALAKAFL